MGMTNYIYILYGIKFNYDELDSILLNDIYNNKLPENLDYIFNHEYETVYVGKLFKHLSKYDAFVGDEIINIEIDDNALINTIQNNMDINLIKDTKPKWYIIGMIL